MPSSINWRPTQEELLRDVGGYVRDRKSHDHECSNLAKSPNVLGGVGIMLEMNDCLELINNGHRYSDGDPYSFPVAKQTIPGIATHGEAVQANKLQLYRDTLQGQKIDIRDLPGTEI
jgi:hypothetical protein